MFNRLENSRLRHRHPVFYVLVFALGTLAGCAGTYLVSKTITPLIGEPISRALGYGPPPMIDPKTGRELP